MRFNPRRNTQSSVFASLFVLCLLGTCASTLGQSDVRVREDTIYIQSAGLRRVLVLHPQGLELAGVYWKDTRWSEPGSQEFSLSFYAAQPNAEPQGIDEQTAQAITQQAAERNRTDVLDIQGRVGFQAQGTDWLPLAKISSGQWSPAFAKATYTIHTPRPETTQLIVRAQSTEEGPLSGVTLELFYEVSQGYPALRKWIRVYNGSQRWLKIDQLRLDDLALSNSLSRLTELTPSERGAVSSLRSYERADQTQGVIVGSEIPSALRTTTARGGQGYTEEFFEWVLGPTESFTSEPVFLYGYQGPVIPTVSRPSTPLDRTVEKAFQQYLHGVVGVRRPQVEDHVPLWCSWSNFGPLISEAALREMAQALPRSGFKGLLVDAGWSQSDTATHWAATTTQADPGKFSDFAGMCQQIVSQGMTLGLWVSTYKDPNLAKDFMLFPRGYILPQVKRENGLAMSFTSRWRYHYAQDMLYLHDRYGVNYFKQDLTNIRFGDIARGHESRSQKESLLRGLRGLLEAQDQVHASAPGVKLELTHEIYWGTPGVPCDLAALKHGDFYHIPPNDYSGVGHWKRRYTPNWPYRPDSLQNKLLEGCWNARQRLYAHRGLPLAAIEYYGAATVNVRGSLTPQVQRRQVCSWLLGAPSVFAGDVASLTPENEQVYRETFSLLGKLQQQYGIYGYFQFSGVPEPTDTDWHWWGKLNEQGSGVVVVVRGSGGETRRKINVPWVEPEGRYRVRSHFKSREWGTYRGKDLIEGKLELALETMDQEILEISRMTARGRK
ncbi:hypothetical protein GCM10027275_21420 [Rhabdobacter roseus]|uniref:Alpha-galactosidase n=1 Tax=Rhabdobacter roseus TaxID=1655419 RepID=A0A840TQT4_9BACT|nr:hypothetical protein [Rhabdobacter roseus]MBB5284077.1 hypothetical protein [Rhabdobacter roseus]